MKITRTDCKIIVSSSYNADLIPLAHAAGGKWNRDHAVWEYDIRAEQQVAEAYRTAYGYWDDVVDTVVLRCTSDAEATIRTDSLKLGGRPIARASGRNSGARLCDGVIILNGGFSSGGSVKNWQTVCKAGTSFRLLDVPKPMAEKLVADPDWCSEIEIEPTEKPAEINRDALIEERTKLMTRITEIDAILHQ